MKLIFIILLLFTLKVAHTQSYVASWTGWGHLSYNVQQGIDSINWTTIGTVNGQMSLNNYQYTIPGPNYYYRIKADSDSSKAILVTEVLSIKNPPPAKGKKNKRILQSLDIKMIESSSNIHYQIESPENQQVQYILYDILGRQILNKSVPLYKGINNIYDKKPIVKGIYIAVFENYFNKYSQQVIVGY